MKRHLIDKLDTANTAQLCANRGEIHESHSCHCQKRCAKLLIQHDDPISPVSHYLFIMLTGLSGLFRFVLQESNIIFDWGHCGTLRNVFWGINTQTVDTVVTVQVCQCYLVQQLRVEFLWQANDLTERIKLRAAPCKRISWCWPHNKDGVCFPIQ